MQRIPRILVCTFLGALLCALLTATLFALMSMVDGTRASEALAYGVVAGVVAAFFGTVVGMVVGIFNLGLLGGALAGLLATAGAVVFYILTFSRPNQYSYFLGESIIIVIVLALPVIITGILVAVVKNRLFT
jgi:MFS family permease